MKKDKGNKIKLGIFVSVAVVLFIIGIYFIGKKQKLFSSTFHISAIFKDISGLQAGNNVRFSGITVGVIDNIQMIADTAVMVDMTIDEGTRKFIKKDAKAVVGSDGLMGNRIVVIMPGSKNTRGIENGDVIPTTVPVSIDDIMQSLKSTSDNASTFLGNLSMITDNIVSGRGTIGKLFMDTTFAEDIDKSVVNIKQGTKGFKQNMDAAKHNFLLRGYFKKNEKDKNEKDKNEKDKTEKDKTAKEKEEKANENK